MKTIVPAKENIAKLWGHPKPKEDVQYRPMKYLLKTQVEDGTLLYNVVTSEIVLLDEAETQMFKEVSATYSSNCDELIASHMLVPENFDEYQSVHQLRAVIKKIDSKDIVKGFTILPTTCCNARCYYCYESNFPHMTMSKETADDVVTYIERSCKGKPITIEWFGGEPTLAADRISQICKGLTDKGILYSSSMVSNAYLLTGRLIDVAKEVWHLKSVQITLDGKEQTYNKVKNYQNVGDNPYRRIIANIDSILLKGIQVNLRLNVSAGNADEIEALVDELLIYFANRKGLSVYAHAIYDDVGFTPLNYDDELREETQVRVQEVNQRLENCGALSTDGKLPFLRTMNCMADNDSCRIIYPDGGIGKCDNSSPEEQVGDIYHDIIDANRVESYKVTGESAVCKECWMFPYCVSLKACVNYHECSDRELDYKLSRYSSILKQSFTEFLKQEQKEG